MVAWIKIGAQPPVVDTFYGTSGEGSIQSYAATEGYAAARGGTAVPVLHNGESDSDAVGQYKSFDRYDVNEAFIQFDTSSIPDANTITEVTLSLRGSNTGAGTWTIEVRLHDWGTAPLTTGDWVAGDNLSGKTLLASRARTGWDSVYNTFTSETAFLSNINKTGYTRMVICSNKTTENTAPTGSETVGFYFGGELQASELRPKLVVTHHA